MPRAINAVRCRPLLDGFLPIQPDYPDAVSIAPLLTTKFISQSQRQSRAGASIICAHKIFPAVKRVVVTSDHNDSILTARKLGNEIPHLKMAHRRSRTECVLLQIVGFQMIAQKLLGLFVPRTSDVARSEPHYLSHVLHRLFSVNPRPVRSRFPALRTLRDRTFSRPAGSARLRRRSLRLCRDNR